MKTNIFLHQHTTAKFVFVIFSILLAVINQFPNLLIIFASTIIYFFWDHQLIIKWFQVLLRLLPFFISLFLLGVIFQIDFEQQLMLSIRICYVLLLSVFLITSTLLENFQADTATWQKYEFTSDLRYFLLAVFQFIPMFLSAYKEVKQSSRLSFSSLGDIMQLCLHKINDVERNLNEVNSVRSFDHRWQADLSLLGLLLINLGLYLRNVL